MQLILQRRISVSYPGSLMAPSESFLAIILSTEKDLIRLILPQSHQRLIEPYVARALGKIEKMPVALRW